RRAPRRPGEGGRQRRRRSERARRTRRGILDGGLSRRSVVRAWSPAHRLLLGLRVLGREDALLGTAGGAALLAPDALDLLLAPARPPADAGLGLLGGAAGPEGTGHRLRPCGLGLDRRGRRAVSGHHTGRDLVHVLPTFAARADEAFHQVVLADAQRGETRDERSLLLGTHGKHCRLAGRYTNLTFLAAGRAEKGYQEPRAWSMEAPHV